MPATPWNSIEKQLNPVVAAAAFLLKEVEIEHKISYADATKEDEMRSPFVWADFDISKFCNSGQITFLGKNLMMFFHQTIDSNMTWIKPNLTWFQLSRILNQPVQT